MLTPDQASILRMYVGLDAAPGQFVPVATLFLNWPPSLPNARFADAVEGLAADGLLLGAADARSYALTDAGAAATRSVVRAG